MATPLVASESKIQLLKKCKNRYAMPVTQV